MKKVRIVELENSWRFEDEEGKLLVETNLFGGVEVVEMMKEDFSFKMKAAEQVEKHYNVEVWENFPSSESEVF